MCQYKSISDSFRKRFICSGMWGMVAAHVIGQSNCISSFATFYIGCINSTWFLEIDDKLIGQIDQVFCYQKDESTCLNATPLEILGPNESNKIKGCPKYTLYNYTITNTTVNNVCGITINCSPASWLVAHFIAEPLYCYYEDEAPYAGYYNGSWMVWHQFKGDDIGDYYPVDQVYCYYDPEPRYPCASCASLPPIVQPNNSTELKCANINSSAIVLGHMMDFDNDTVCRRRFRCDDAWGMAAAHVIGQSNCISTFTTFYFECINSTWFLDIDENPSEPIDQVFCYQNDENTCSKSNSTPLPILDPGDTNKIRSCSKGLLGNYTITNTTVNSVCGIAIICSPPSRLAAHYITETPKCYYQDSIGPYAGYYNGSWMMWMKLSEYERGNFYPVDQLYCFYDPTLKQPCSSCPQELPLMSTTTQCSLPGLISSNYTVINTTADDGICCRSIVCDAPDARPFVHFTSSSCRYNANNDNAWELHCYNGSWITDDQLGGWEAVDEVGCYVPATTTTMTSTIQNSTEYHSTRQHSTELMTTLTTKSTTSTSRTSSKIDKFIIIAVTAIVWLLITIAIILCVWNRRRGRLLWTFENAAMPRRRSVEMLQL